MSCLKNYVMREPLIDTVDKRQICTDHFPLKVNRKRNEISGKKIYEILFIRCMIWKQWQWMILISIQNSNFVLFEMIMFMHLSLISLLNSAHVHRKHILIPVRLGIWIFGIEFVRFCSARCRLYTLETNSILFSWLCHDKTWWSVRRNILQQS